MLKWKFSQRLQLLDACKEREKTGHSFDLTRVSGPFRDTGRYLDFWSRSARECIASLRNRGGRLDRWRPEFVRNSPKVQFERNVSRRSPCVSPLAVFNPRFFARTMTRIGTTQFADVFPSQIPDTGRYRNFSVAKCTWVYCDILDSRVIRAPVRGGGDTTRIVETIRTSSKTRIIFRVGRRVARALIGVISRAYEKKNRDTANVFPTLLGFSVATRIREYIASLRTWRDAERYHNIRGSSVSFVSFVRFRELDVSRRTGKRVLRVIIRRSSFVRRRKSRQCHLDVFADPFAMWSAKRNFTQDTCEYIATL